MASDRPNLYQRIRTGVKKGLHHVVDLVGMEPAIRAETELSAPEAEQALLSYLDQAGLSVLAETDVQAIHHAYDLDYPHYKIFKVAAGDSLGACPMASRAIEIHKGTTAFLPPSIVVYERDDGARVSAVRPSTLMALFSDDELRSILGELEHTLWTAFEDGLPGSTMLSEEAPVRKDDTQGRIKGSLYSVLSLLDAEYSFHVSTPKPRAEIREELEHALSMRGQKVLGEVEAPGTSILLVANPGQAHKLLAIDPDVGVFAPLSVGVYEEGGRTHVRCVRPSTLLIFYTNPAIQAILLELEVLLWNAVTSGVPDVKIHSRQPPLPSGLGQRATAEGLPGGLDSFRQFRSA